MSIGEKISIVIVTYNSDKYIQSLVRSIHEYLDSLVKEIIIIDNNSINNEYLDNIENKKIKIIKNRNNLGFSKAVNQGINMSKSKYILLLNPDTLIINNSIINMYKKILSEKNIGAIGGEIIDKNYRTQLSATNRPNLMTAIFEFTNLKKVFPNNHYSSDFWMKKKLNNSFNQKVFSLCGAFILFNKQINNKIINFDEKYFLYMEDIDLGYKFHEQNKDVVYFPKAKIMHIGGASSKSKYNIELKHWYKSRKYFFLKHLGYISGLLLYTIFTLEELVLLIYHKIKNEPAF